MSRPALSACGATGSSRGLPACSGAAGVSRGSKARWVRPERCLNEAGSALMGTPLNRGETNERGAGTARHKQTVPSCLNEDVPSRSSVKCNFSFFYNNSAAPPPLPRVSLPLLHPLCPRSIPANYAFRAAHETWHPPPTSSFTQPEATPGARAPVMLRR